MQIQMQISKHYLSLTQHILKTVPLADVCVSVSLLCQLTPLSVAPPIYLPEGSGQGEGFSTVLSELVNFHCRERGILSHIPCDRKNSSVC